MRPSVVAIAPLAIFLAACENSPTLGIDPATLEAPVACATPAPLKGVKDSAAPRYIVVFKAGTSVPATVSLLAQKYGFTPTHLYQHALLGFAAELSLLAVAGIRCEAFVEYIEHDARVSLN